MLWRIFGHAVFIGIGLVALSTIVFGQSIPPVLQADLAGPGIRDVWELAKGAGLFGTALMWYVWQRESNERRKLQGERDALLERVLTANNSQISSIESIRHLLQSVLTGRPGS